MIDVRRQQDRRAVALALAVFFQARQVASNSTTVISVAQKFDEFLAGR